MIRVPVSLLFPDFDFFNEYAATILDAKVKYVRYMINKLNDPLTAHKNYWSILNRFLNNGKIPATLPILGNGDIITNFSKKAGFFNQLLQTTVHPLII